VHSFLESNCRPCWGWEVILAIEALEAAQVFGVEPGISGESYAPRPRNLQNACGVQKTLWNFCTRSQESAKCHVLATSGLLIEYRAVFGSVRSGFSGVSARATNPDTTPLVLPGTVFNSLSASSLAGVCVWRPPPRRNSTSLERASLAPPAQFHQLGKSVLGPPGRGVRIWKDNFKNLMWLGWGGSAPTYLKSQLRVRCKPTTSRI
jgi:hypothetical protein